VRPCVHLEAKGIIERTRDGYDGRMVRIRSTPFSAENLSRVRAVWTEILTDLLADAAENAHLAAVLRRLDAGRG
jgi:DNA-binding MarR family transcriptional regulator